MLLHMYLVFSFLLGDIHFWVHFFFNFMEYFFLDTLYHRKGRNVENKSRPKQKYVHQISYSETGRTDRQSLKEKLERI